MLPHKWAMSLPELTFEAEAIRDSVGATNWAITDIQQTPHKCQVQPSLPSERTKLSNKDNSRCSKPLNDKWIMASLSIVEVKCSYLVTVPRMLIDLKQTSGARCQVCAQATLNRKVVMIRGQGERYHLHHVCAITCFSCRVLPRRARSITRCSRPSNDNMYSSEFQYIQTILIGD